MKQILVIDDEESMREVLRASFESLGYGVAEAENGKVGLERFAESPADLVITDLIMPEKEGLETIRELKRISPQLPIVAITGAWRANSMSSLKIARHFGAAAALAKPFALPELAKVVEDLLSPGAASPSLGLDSGGISL